MNQRQFLRRIQILYKENLETCRKKNHDYAGSTDPFRNFKACEMYGLTVEEGLIVRMSDKMVRISNLLKSEAKVKDEKITDSLKDLANYAMILSVYLENKNRSEIISTPRKSYRKSSR